MAMRNANVTIMRLEVRMHPHSMLHRKLLFSFIVSTKWLEECEPPSSSSRFRVVAAVRGGLKTAEGI